MKKSKENITFTVKIGEITKGIKGVSDDFMDITFTNLLSKPKIKPNINAFLIGCPAL